ncbi:MAG: HAD family hydrolase, partial [Staphylococcus hominis]
ALADVLLIPTVDLGCPKPQRAAYLAACDQLGAAPADTLMVGDSLANDVQGARTAGLHALHLDRAGNGDLRSLSALKEVLPQRAS